MLQQALLLFSAGSIVGIMPVLFAVFFMMLRGWSSAVYKLSTVRHYRYEAAAVLTAAAAGGTVWVGWPVVVSAAAAATGGGGAGGGSVVVGAATAW